MIEIGLRDVALALGAERATLWQRVANRDQFTKTHRWPAAGVPKPSDVSNDDALPWIHGKLVSGEVWRDSLAMLNYLRSADTDLDGAERVLGPRRRSHGSADRTHSVVGALSLRASPPIATGRRAGSRVTPLGEASRAWSRGEASERRETKRSSAAHAARVGSMGTLAASLVHELTQPLAASLANAETAAELLAAPSPDLEAPCLTIDDIVSDDRASARLDQQLRRFLRRSEAEWTEIRIGEVIGDNLRIAAGDAAEKEIVVTLDIPDNLPTLVGDRVQIQQVLLNLLLNAVDAVATREVERRRVAVVAACRRTA